MCWAESRGATEGLGGGDGSLGGHADTVEEEEAGHPLLLHTLLTRSHVRFHPYLLTHNLSTHTHTQLEHTHTHAPTYTHRRHTRCTYTHMSAALELK